MTQKMPKWFELFIKSKISETLLHKYFCFSHFFHINKTTSKNDLKICLPETTPEINVLKDKIVSYYVTQKS